MIHPTAIVSKNSKVHDSSEIGPFCIIDDNVEQTYVPGKVKENQQLKMSGLYQYHFNTFEMNKWLTELATKLNIELIDDEIKEVKLNDNGEIDELIFFILTHTEQLKIVKETVLQTHIYIHEGSSTYSLYPAHI